MCGQSEPDIRNLKKLVEGTFGEISYDVIGHLGLNIKLCIKQ